MKKALIKTMKTHNKANKNKVFVSSRKEIILSLFSNKINYFPEK